MATYLSRVRLFEQLDMANLVRRTSDMKRTPAKWTCGANLERNCSKAEPCCWPLPVPQAATFLPNCTKSKKASCGMLNLNSEKFLELTMWLANNVTVVHRQDWAFCKFGEIGHSWTGCTSRMRNRVPCRSLVCVAWSAGGCRCQNSTCARGYNPYCIDTSQTQLRLDGTLLGHADANQSVDAGRVGFPYHVRSNAHRAVARAFLRHGSRHTGARAAVSKPALAGKASQSPEGTSSRLARRISVSNVSRAFKQATKALKRATHGGAVSSVALHTGSGAGDGSQKP